MKTFKDGIFLFKGQGISSLQNYLPPRGGPPTRECLWIIKPDVDFGTAIIQLQINSSQLNVTCGENAVYVYDGLPELVEMGSQSALTAVFCTEEALPTAVVESRTGKFVSCEKYRLCMCICKKNPQLTYLWI